MAEAKQIPHEPDTDSTTDSVAAPVHRRKPGAANLVVATATAAAILWGAWWLYDRLSNVYVLDARIAADMLLLSSRVPGRVVAVSVSESQSVAVGQVLVQIDSRSAEARVGELAAGVEVLDASLSVVSAKLVMIDQLTASRIDAAAANLDAALSEQNAARGDLEIAEAEWNRAGPLRERNLLSQKEFEASRNDYRSAEQTARRRDAQVASARADLAEARSERAEIKVLEADSLRLQNERTQALLQLEQAQAELDYHTIQATSGGVIDELFIDPGEYVQPGQRILMMHNPDRLWIKANVKETDLSHFEPGTRVSILVDAYPDEARGGVVRRVGGAARSQFALLPNPNPSGNFTKVTQRIETAIEFDEHDPRLKPGMMVEVKLPRQP